MCVRFCERYSFFSAALLYVDTRARARPPPAPRSRYRVFPQAEIYGLETLLLFFPPFYLPGQAGPRIRPCIVLPDGNCIVLP
jgi:hypothetical protein